MFNIANYTSNYRGQLIINCYNNWIKPKDKVLDIGCGTGIIASLIKQTFKAQVIGCDVNNYLSKNIPFIKIDSKYTLPFKNTSFDIAMLNDVLHHVPKNEQRALILESLRIANKVLIFEIEPTKIGVFFDIVLNLIHYGGLNTPLSHRTNKKWINLFKTLNLNFEVAYANKPSLYPFKHIAYCISKK